MSWLKQARAAHPLSFALSTAAIAYLAISAAFFLAAPPLETNDGPQHYHYIRWLLSQRTLPVLGQEIGTIAPRQEAAQPPLYYLLGAALSLPIDISDFDNVAMLNPSGGARDADANQNSFLHRPLTWPPHGAQLSMRLVEVMSIACGLLTVGAAVVLARWLVAGHPWMWLATGLAVGADSTFDYHFSQINNDCLLVALCSLTLVALGCWLEYKRQVFAWVAAGAIGLGLLTKFNAVGLVPLYLLACWWMGKTWEARAHAAIPLLLVLPLLDGWWFVRAAVLYGDPTTLFVLNGAYNANYHPIAGENLRLLPSAMAFTFHSFFSMYGIAENIDSLPAFAVTAALASVGFAFGLGSTLATKRRGTLNNLLFAWLAITALQVFAYCIAEGGGGRFVFPAMAPLAIYTVIGWKGLLRKIPSFAAPSGVALACVALSVPPLVAGRTVAPVFAYPPVLTTLPSIGTPLRATFAGSIQLLGADLPNGVLVQPEREYPVTLYWRLQEPVTDLYKTFVHVDSNDPSYRSGAAYDGPSGRGTYPPSFWNVGEVVVDRYTFRVNRDERADRRNTVLLPIRAGFYQSPTVPGQPIRKVVADPSEASDVGFEIGAWRLAGSPPPLPNTPPLARFPAGLDLVSASASARAPGQVQVDLRWLTQRALGESLTVFVQLISAEGKLIAQHDSYPLDGRYPTTAWLPQEQVFDSVALSSPRPIQTGDSVILGLYRLPSTERLLTEQGESFVRLPLQ